MAGLIKSSLLQSLDAQEEDFSGMWSISSSICLWREFVTASGSCVCIAVTLWGADWGVSNTCGPVLSLGV